jgi:hypothetical protein
MITTAGRYNGTERGISLAPEQRTRSAFAYDLRPPEIPSGAQPIVDEGSGDCVGYAWEGAKGVWHIFDVTGQRVWIEEAPLESPLIDPLDLILIGAGVVKLLRAGAGAVAVSLASRGAAVATGRMARHVVPLLRSRIKGLSALRIQFTETTARHMANPGRRVPVHILHLAIKYGKRGADPQKVAGVFRYEIPMVRLVKRGTVYVRETKTLEVVVRESDWTILHFMYF